MTCKLPINLRSRTYDTSRPFTIAPSSEIIRSVAAHPLPAVVCRLLTAFEWQTPLSVLSLPVREPFPKLCVATGFCWLTCVARPALYKKALKVHPGQWDKELAVPIASASAAFGTCKFAPRSPVPHLCFQTLEPAHRPTKQAKQGRQQASHPTNQNTNKEPNRLNNQLISHL
jgi:hypothetical protein